MLNIDHKVQGDTLVITIDLTRRHGASKSGKSTIIASTEGQPTALG